MLKKTLLPFLCISIALSSMEENSDPTTKKILMQQSCSRAWEDVKKTQEFRSCVELIKLQRNPAHIEFKDAFKKLHATEEFQHYMRVGQPPFNQSLLNIEQIIGNISGEGT